MPPPINHLNPPPNPFWDFVADMQNHPFFAAYAPPQNGNQSREEGTATAEAGPSNTNAGEKQPQQQTNIDDPPEVDPETLAGEPRGERRDRCRGRRRRGSNSDEEGEHHRRGGFGRRGWGGPWGRRGWGGPPGGFPFGGQPDLPPWARPQGDEEQHSPLGPPQLGTFIPGHGPAQFGPFIPGHGPPPGPFGRGGIHRRGGPHSHHHEHDHDHHHGALPHRRGPGGPGGMRGPGGPRHHRGPSPHHHHHRGPSPPGFGPPGPHGGFDLKQFLNDLGARIGIDLSGAAENLGLDKFMPGAQNSGEVDFEPKADIFSAPTKYTIHISLPGAKKSDVGVDWDGEHSSLHVAGVVHRPEVDEAMLSQLVVDGRKRETGVFEKTIRLGTRREPAIVDVAGIKARMVDGVLIVTVPKLERRNEKRDVSISKSETPSPVREVRNSQTNEKDHEMTDLLHEEEEGEIQLIDRTQFEQSKNDIEKGKEAEHREAEKTTRESSATIEAEPNHQAEAEHETEQLPKYTNVDAAVERQEGHGSDWENFGSDDEGEYVKINVD